MVAWSAFVLGEDEQVTREDDAVIDVFGTISYNIVFSPGATGRKGHI